MELNDTIRNTVKHLYKHIKVKQTKWCCKCCFIDGYKCLLYGKGITKALNEDCDPFYDYMELNK